MNRSGSVLGSRACGAKSEAKSGCLNWHAQQDSNPPPSGSEPSVHRNGNTTVHETSFPVVNCARPSARRSWFDCQCPEHSRSDTERGGVSNDAPSAFGGFRVSRGWLRDVGAGGTRGDFALVLAAGQSGLLPPVGEPGDFAYESAVVPGSVRGSTNSVVERGAIA